jgi:alkaline phosphatase
LRVGFVQLALYQPENIVFFIGDGMGFEQVKASSMYANGVVGSLSFEDFLYQAKAQPSQPILP